MIADGDAPRLEGNKICFDRFCWSLPEYFDPVLIGKGASGYAFRVRNKTLNSRTEVLKIWKKLRGNDERDKAIQGYLEINKQAIAKGGVPVVYRADHVNDHFYALMEFIPGIQLADWLKDPKNTFLQRIRMASEYIRVSSQFGRGQLVHGDPHAGNIIVNDESPVLIDFGTSYFNGREYGIERHWKITEATFSKIVEPMPFAQLRVSPKFNDILTRDLLGRAHDYNLFLKCIPHWLYYLGIYPKCRGTSTFYQSREPDEWAIDDHTKNVLDNLDPSVKNQLERLGFLGEPWSV